MNKGLTDELKAGFPDVIPVARPLVTDQVIPSEHWVAGFATAEGNF